MIKAGRISAKRIGRGYKIEMAEAANLLATRVMGQTKRSR
jgi:urease gamma subunit